MEDVAQACFGRHEWDKADGEGNYSYHETVERGHGRSGEPPNTSRSKAPSGLRDQALWEDLRTVSMVVSPSGEWRERRLPPMSDITSAAAPGKAKEYAG